MATGHFVRYRDVFANRSFRHFWLGFVGSSIGDAMTRVALIWFVFDATGSARALGFLALAYTGPILIGGLVAGALLDRFDRRNVMMADNLVRGAAILLVPVLHAAGRLELWHVYAVAVVYGALMMISLAGGPAILPSLVRRDQLVTVNALEMMSFTLGGVIGAPLAGLLIVWIGAPNVLVVDALSYVLYALAIYRVRYLPAQVTETSQPARAYRLKDAFVLLLGNRILLSTTAMFMAFNVGQGFLFVWLPIFAERTLHGDPALYGFLLGGIAAGQLVSSILAGSLTPRVPLGTMICLFQSFAGLSLIVLLFGNVWLAATGLILYGVCSAPLTIWAQTLRMAIIPERLRGRTFALLRMLMQGTGPLGSTVAGFLLPAVGIMTMIALSGALVGAPGPIGYQVDELREGGCPTARDDVAPVEPQPVIQEAGS